MANATATLVASGHYASWATTHDTAAFDVTTDDWLVICAHAFDNGTTALSSVSGLSGVTVAPTQLGSGLGDDNCRINAFLGKPSVSDGNGALQLTFTSAVEYGGWNVFKLGNVDPTNPEVTTARTFDSAISLSMPTRESAESVRIIFFGDFHHRTTTAVTAGYTETFDSGTGVVAGMHSFVGNTDSACAPTWNDTSTSFLAGLGLEFRVAPAAAASPPRWWQRSQYNHLLVR